MFGLKFKKTAKDLMGKYPKKKHALLPLLHLVQKENGYISNDSVNYLAKLCDVSFNHIQGVVSFYTMFTQKERGKNQISVCTNLSCWIKGAENIFKHLEEKLEISNNQTTLDKKFFLEEIECLGACGYAPVVSINGKYHENIDAKKIDLILDQMTAPKTTKSD